MTSVVFYFQVHQPHRLRTDAGPRATLEERFAPAFDRSVLERVAERCYRPMNTLLRAAVARTGGAFRCALSVSGTALEQLERWAPDVLDGFRALVETGAVELLAETSHHSLCSVTDPADCPADFTPQVLAHRAAVEALCGRTPRTFRNTELILDNTIAARAEALGFDVVLGEGADHLLAGRAPHAVWRQPGCTTLRTLLRDHRLSDDIGFRFGDPHWPHHPLAATTFASWLGERAAAGAEAVGLFMDYETFGEHRAAETGVFDFFAGLPEAVARDPRCAFRTPFEAATATSVQTRPLDVPDPVSWADAPRDLGAWLGNPMQREAHSQLHALYPAARAAARRGDPEMLEAWRRLGTSDHLYYMATQHWTDGYMHAYFSPFATPLQAFVAYMGALDQLARRLSGARA